MTRQHDRPRNYFTSTLDEGNTLRRHGPGSLKAKLQIRENLLAEIGCARAHVLDLYCGGGELYRGVWNKAASYVGCDESWYQDERVQYVADNRRLLRCLDLTPYSCVDFDSFGSPWLQVALWSERRRIAPDEKVALAITDGSGLRLKMGYLPDGLAYLSGMRRHLGGGTARNHEDILDRTLGRLCQKMNCRIVKQWRAKGRGGSALFYIGLVLEGVADA